MFDKVIVNKHIKKLQKEISLLEQKRSRSQAALVRAILQNTEPMDDDLEYFKNYSAEIERLRTEIQKLKKKLL